jgi:hypothetical protein
VHASVPLDAIVFLKQSPVDAIEPLRAGPAAARLAQAAEEVSPLAWSKAAPDQIRQQRLQRFEWLSALARHTPTFTLQISLTGLFWVPLEQTLGWDSRRA